MVRLEAVGASHRFFSLPISEVYHKTENLSSLLTLKIRYHYHRHYHSPPPQLYHKSPLLSNLTKLPFRDIIPPGGLSSQTSTTTPTQKRISLMPPTTRQGGWGAPGGRVFRTEKLWDELMRIVFTTLFTILCSALIIAFCLFDAYITGPILGLLAGVTLIIYIAAYFLPLAKRYGAEFFLTLTALLAIIAWGTAGDRWLHSIWLPWTCPWPVWLKLSALVLSLASKATLAISIRSFLSEQLDPNGPTPPRDAVIYPRTIWPWTHLPTEEPPLPHPAKTKQIWIESDDVDNGNDSSNDVDNDNSPTRRRSWKMTEATARRFHIPLEDRIDELGYLVPGFRTIRGELTSRGWGGWKNPQSHRAGFVLYPEGLRALQALVEED